MRAGQGIAKPEEPGWSGTSGGDEPQTCRPQDTGIPGRQLGDQQLPLVHCPVEASGQEEVSQTGSMAWPCCPVPFPGRGRKEGETSRAGTKGQAASGAGRSQPDQELSAAREADGRGRPPSHCSWSLLQQPQSFLTTSATQSLAGPLPGSVHLQLARAMPGGQRPGLLEPALDSAHSPQVLTYHTRGLSLPLLSPPSTHLSAHLAETLLSDLVAAGREHMCAPLWQTTLSRFPWQPPRQSHEQLLPLS